VFYIVIERKLLFGWAVGTDQNWPFSFRPKRSRTQGLSTKVSWAGICDSGIVVLSMQSVTLRHICVYTV